MALARAAGQVLLRSWLIVVGVGCSATRQTTTEPSSGGGGLASNGGTTAIGGTPSAGGSSSTGGTKATGGVSNTGSCSFTIITNSISPGMATVGIVKWSTSLSNVSSAQIEYRLNSAGSTILNRGGIAPVDLTKSSYHTLLLGLKQSSDYTFQIEATSSDGTRCRSSDYALPTTGTLSGAPSITRTSGSSAPSQAKGFIITSEIGGIGAFIIDADGAIVWYAASPVQCSRALLDYEGANVWMLAVNVANTGGEMRYVSLDGQTTQKDVSGLSSAHHDFTILPGKIATMGWASSGTDQPSDLLEYSSDGTVRTAFHIGSNLYHGGQSAWGANSNAYHANSIVYHSADDSYTIGDRYPSLFVKVTRTGQAVWQFGGSCADAKAPKCASGTWQANHGHQLLNDGNLLFFSNGPFGNSSFPSRVYEFMLATSGSTMTATQIQSFTSPSNSHSDSLGDVQRLPNGNTLITFSNNGRIEEVDSSWAAVQTLTASSFGYAHWRETLYGPEPNAVP
jgi:hypothetical protein